MKNSRLNLSVAVASEISGAKENLQSIPTAFLNIQLPNTFIIGAPKSGTTSLVAYLSSHPQAFLPNPIEPDYWTKETPKDNEHKYSNSWAGYKQLYNKATEGHTVRIDCSRSYCWSDYAVPDILKTLPNSRFIFMIRNPVELAPSLHSEEVLSGHEDIDDYNDAWKLQSELLAEQGHELTEAAAGRLRSRPSVRGTCA